MWPDEEAAMERLAYLQSEYNRIRAKHLDAKADMLARGYVPLSVRVSRRKRLGWWWRGVRERAAFVLAPWLRFDD